MKIKYILSRFPYAIRKRFKRGITLTIAVTWKCNLMCPKCALACDGKMPKDSSSEIDWIGYIKTFPVKIKEIYLTGGEPHLYDKLIPLSNWILDNGYMLTIFSNNTMIDKYLKIIQHRNLRFNITYYDGVHEKYKWLLNYKLLSKRHTVHVDEIESHVFYFSRTKPQTNDGKRKIPNKGHLRVGPDGQIYRSCFELSDSYKEHTND